MTDKIHKNERKCGEKDFLYLKTMTSPAVIR